MSKKQKAKSGEAVVDSSPKVHQRDKISTVLKIREFPWSEKQKQLLSILEDKKTKIVFVTGPAGSAKTCCAIYAALKSLNEKRVSDILYLRQPVESSSYNLGFLKGDLQTKIDPYQAPLDDKLSEFLSETEINALKKDERLHTIPIGFLRGRSFACQYIIFDEAQNGNTHDMLLVMTRLGKFSKLIITGDVSQSDIKQSALQKVAAVFDTEESRGHGIHVFKFGKEDIFRNEVLSHVIEKFEEINQPKESDGQEWRPRNK
jgi:phosphate starvation-inducible PhoH-like protein